MEVIDPQSTTHPKPKKPPSVSPLKPRRDLRIIDGKPMIVEVIGDKVVKVIGEKKNPYKDIVRQSQGEHKEDKPAETPSPVTDSDGISTLSTPKIDTKVNETPKVEDRVADTKGETAKDATPVEQPVNTTSDQAFSSGTNNAINDIIGSQAAHDIGAQLIVDNTITKGTVKEKENVTTQPVTSLGIGNLAEKLDPKAKDSKNKMIDNAKLDKKTTTEAKRMGDENQKEIDEETVAKAVDRRLKDINFKKSIDDAVKFAGESRTRLTDLHKEIGSIEDKVGTINKSVDNMCEGVDCIKNDFKSAQERQVEFEKQVQNGMQALADKVQKLEDPTYVCDNCGEDAIKALSSYCPNCGNPIPQWTGEDGHPVQGWKPFWERLKQAKVS